MVPFNNCYDRHQVKTKADGTQKTRTHARMVARSTAYRCLLGGTISTQCEPSPLGAVLSLLGTHRKLVDDWFGIASLIAASMIPMAYCRYGCATGRLIDYLRRSAKSHQLTLADGAVVLLAVVAIGMRLNQN